jgi:hypothetical protein
MVNLPHREIPGGSGEPAFPWLRFIHSLTKAGQNEKVEKGEKGETENFT